MKLSNPFHSDLNFSRPPVSTGHARRAGVKRWLSAVLLLGSLALTQAQAWYSLQEGDVRTGSDRTTVNTAGTLVTTNYNTGATYIELNRPDTNFFGRTNLITGTFNAVTNYDRVLLSFDLSPLTNFIGGQAFSASGYLHLTFRDAGGAFGATFALHAIKPFNETNATWSNPGPGMPAGGVIDDSVRLATMSISPATYPAVTEWIGLNDIISQILANPTNKLVCLLIKRNAEGQGDYNKRYVTDQNTDPAFGGIDARPELQVGITILTNTPLVSVAASTPDASEPTNTGSFTISRTVNTTNVLTVYFSYGVNPASGQAIEGADFTSSLDNSVTLPAGVVSTNIVITPIDNSNPDETRRAVLNIGGGGTNYGIAVATATVKIHDDNDGAALAQWFFGYDLTATVWNTNIAASAITSPTLFTPLDTAINISAPGSLWVQGVYTTNNAADAVTLNNYFSLSVTPKAGYGVTLTNLDLMTIYYNNSDPSPNSAVLFVRSSLDNYSNTVAAVTNLVTDLGGGWQESSFPLDTTFSNLTGQVTFRFYVYDDGVDAALRVDNLFLRGQTTIAPAGPPNLTDITVASGNVQLNFAGVNSDTTGSFQLQSSVDVTGPYADVASTIIQTGPGQFRASLPANGNQQFYRIKRTN